MTDYVEAWQCIGCGKIEAPQTCIGVCRDRKVAFVYAEDHEQQDAEPGPDGRDVHRADAAGRGRWRGDSGDIHGTEPIAGPGVDAGRPPARVNVWRRPIRGHQSRPARGVGLGSAGARRVKDEDGRTDGTNCRLLTDAPT